MDKNKHLSRILAKKNIDAMIITDGYNIHYYSGYKGHTGCMFITKEKQYILTDSRYTEQVSIEAPDFVCVDIKSKGYGSTLRDIIDNLVTEKDYLSDTTVETSRLCIGFENKHISYNLYNAFKEKLEDVAELVHLDEEINSLRKVKSQDEIDKIAMAEAIGDKAFEHIIEFIQEGMTEKEIALELEYTMKQLGAEGLSFDTIAASGPDSSLPHATPTDRKVENGDFITLDFGCVYKGYCSDMTRTLLVGDEMESKKINVYTTVLKAQREALKMIKPGVKCSDVDACARNIIKEAGYGEYFGHGLGHSVGLFIHEEPILSSKCDDILEPGMVVTVEPGIYLPGEFGVRIEDLVVVTEDGYLNLTSSPKELICLC